MKLLDCVASGAGPGCLLGSPPISGVLQAGVACFPTPFHSRKGAEALDFSKSLLEFSLDSADWDLE
jgi:hypothetical protein